MRLAPRASRSAGSATISGRASATVHRETYRIVAGLKGDLGGSWKWNSYYQYGRTNYDQAQSNNRINSRFTKAVDAVRNTAGHDRLPRQCGCNITTNDDPACSAAQPVRPEQLLAAGEELRVRHRKCRTRR
jgi:hypothetical protein